MCVLFARALEAFEACAGSVARLVTQMPARLADPSLMAMRSGQPGRLFCVPENLKLTRMGSRGASEAASCSGQIGKKGSITYEKKGAPLCLNRRKKVCATLATPLPIYTVRNTIQVHEAHVLTTLVLRRTAVQLIDTDVYSSEHNIMLVYGLAF